MIYGWQEGVLLALTPHEWCKAFTSGCTSKAHARQDFLAKMGERLFDLFLSESQLSQVQSYLETT